MNTTELLAAFRTEVTDTVAPYLWSDALVYSLIDEAQKQFCRDTYGIADARSFTLAIVPATQWYTLDPRILKIRNAIDSATGKPIAMVPVEKMDAQNMAFDGGVGRLKALVTGLENDAVRAWPVPDAAGTVELHTFRLPADVATGDDLEVASHHHPFLLHWVKHRAYGIPDGDAFDPKASEKYLGLHIAYCAKALIEQSRKFHTAGTVVYGG